LPMAERLGYVAVGIEPDPMAVKKGIAQGRDVRCGSLEAHDLPPRAFDHITLAHVLEHFHDPIAALDEVRRLLRPGGRVWINQPNLGSLGRAEFGRHWRGLEPPRHMVLMTPARLLEILHDRGFVRSELKKPPYDAAYYFSASVMIRDHGSMEGWTPGYVAKARDADAQAFVNPAVAESMTAVAYEPW
jgi:SAM-dependent methyltransferase